MTQFQLLVALYIQNWTFHKTICTNCGLQLNSRGLQTFCQRATWHTSYCWGSDILCCDCFEI